MHRMLLINTVMCLCAPFVPDHGQAAPSEALSGPVSAHVERVIDGDTIEVRAHIWLNTDVMVRVRLSGIDTPEISRADCPAERAKGLTAQARLTSLVQDQSVFLHDVQYGKYAGRVVARVKTDQGIDVSKWLLATGYAVEYSGAQNNWCTDILSENRTR